ncbi:hypothetical protein LUZ62_051553 [Rhynchospora pubera]|uniref:non-specific serine/threonine protein kinase n=1 Tax=Rhynchospora pubera TaxID=906938 RepID=A0AAV8GAI7_9POAL|nr:hypothetical protein LUZ62_051553 [Rhynchospora pubera]
MGKIVSEHVSESGSDGSATNSDGCEQGILELDPTKRYMRYADPLGKGAYKKVWKAFDQIDGIEVAWNRVSIDRMLQSPENLSRLYSEVHFLKTLRHENILKYYNSWVDDEKRTVNIITELFTSGTLREYRKKHNCVDLKAIKNWARQILRGLEYLHSHETPIIHRDLKCDNIFINGNNGEVKIGDLGLATMMLQEKARSVLGTPEFMAPELYEEEYNELVDIYSFGMCMLEMVTLDYPYSECHNAAQIYKRVTSGVKPAALEKITNLQVRQFIEQCLVPASERKSAKELLRDPFLHCNNSHEMKPNKVPTPLLPPKSLSGISAEEILLDLEAECKSEPISEDVEANNIEVKQPYLELIRINEGNEFFLQGVREDENTIQFHLDISGSYGPPKTVDFMFYLDSDTSLRVADEMVEQLELPDYDVLFISEFIDYHIMCLVPDWRPLTDEFSSVDNGSTVENGSTLENEIAFETELMGSMKIDLLSLENRSDNLSNRLSSNSALVDDDITRPKEACEEAKSNSGSSSTLVQLLETCEETKFDSGSSSSSMNLLGSSEEPKTNSCASQTVETSNDAKDEPGFLLLSTEPVRTFAADVDSTAIECNCEKGESSVIPNGCHVVEAIGKKLLNGCTLQLDEDDDDSLQSEVDDIKEHYRHLFEELTRMRDVAIENARKRWARKIGKRPA